MPASVADMGDERKSGGSASLSGDRMDVDEQAPASTKAQTPISGHQSTGNHSSGGSHRPKAPDNVIESDLNLLNKVITQCVPAATLRATMDNWRKCVVGDPKTESFIVRAILKNGKPRLWERIFHEQGDAIIKNAPESFLDKVFEQRLATIDGRKLVNLLAKAERLGYREEDIIDEAEFVSPVQKSPPTGQVLDQPHMNAHPATVLAPVQRGVQPQEPRQIIFHTAPQPSNTVPVQVFRQMQNGEMNAGHVTQQAPPPPRPKGDKRFVCEDCNYQFAQAAGLKYHTDNKVCQRDNNANAQPPKPKYHCENCGRGFSTQAAFKYVSGNGFQNAVFCGACAAALAEGRLELSQSEQQGDVNPTPPGPSPSPNSKKKAEERLAAQTKWLAESAARQGLSTTLDNTAAKIEPKIDGRGRRKSIDSISTNQGVWTTSNGPVQNTFAAVNAGRPAGKPLSAASTPGSSVIDPDPYRHLTPEQLAELNAKIEVTDREWDEESTAMENSDEFSSQLEKEEALRKLKAIYATKKSIIRRKYGVNLRKRKSGAGAGRELVMGPTPEIRKARLEKFKNHPTQHQPIAAMGQSRPSMPPAGGPSSSSFNAGHHPYQIGGSPVNAPPPIQPNPLSQGHMAPSPHQQYRPPGYNAQAYNGNSPQVQWLPASTPTTGVPGSYPLQPRPVGRPPGPHSHPIPSPVSQPQAHPSPVISDDSGSPVVKRRKVSFPEHQHRFESPYGTPEGMVIDSRATSAPGTQHSTPVPTSMPAQAAASTMHEPSPAPPPSAESVSKRMSMNRITSPQLRMETPTHRAHQPERMEGVEQTTGHQRLLETLAASRPIEGTHEPPPPRRRSSVKLVERPQEKIQERPLEESQEKVEEKPVEVEIPPAKAATPPPMAAPPNPPVVLETPKPETAATPASANQNHTSPRRRSRTWTNPEPMENIDDQSPRQTRSRDKKQRDSTSSKRDIIKNTDDEEEHDNDSDDEDIPAVRPSRHSTRNKARAESPAPSSTSGSPMVTRGKSRASRGGKEKAEVPERKSERSGLRSTRSSMARAGN